MGTRNSKMSIAESDVAQLAALMPPLAGQKLETPHFHPVGWQDGQLFTAEDDPDRVMQFNWTPPDFACTQPPLASSLDLDVPNANPGRFARVVREVLDEQQCASLIRSVNTKGL